MRVVWTRAAEQDRAEIIDFIARDNPLAAIRMDERFERPQLNDCLRTQCWGGQGWLQARAS